MKTYRNYWLALFVVAALSGESAQGAFNVQYSIPNPASFTSSQLAILNAGLAQSEAMWETVLTGYQPGINIPSLNISVFATTSGLASANPGGIVQQGGFSLATSGTININVNQIEPFANWQGDEPNGLNFIDELMVHETGHVLGIGPLWSSNGVYAGNFQYTGLHGIAAYRAEFDPTATFVPVENGGGPGTPHNHWDQFMRSAEAVPPAPDPFLLDPRVGVTDRYGRDRALEVMTGAIDPDFREPFLSRLTVESFRDMGYTVAAFEDANGDGAVNFADLEILNANLGATGLQIDSIRFGDVDRDRDVDMADYQLTRAAIPEPAGAVMALLAFAALAARRGRGRKALE